MDSPGSDIALSGRQTRVLEMIADGKMTAGIAWDLGISPRTVEIYRDALRNRLGAVHMAHAVAIAFRAGILK